MQRTFTILICLAALFLAGCSSSPAYYRYSAAKGGRIVDGLAVAPDNAPDEVKAAIEAGNRIAGLPYRYGGGRCNGVDSGYDCSGSTSYVLREAGLMNGCMTSSDFRSYGRSGEGRWITIFARHGHVFMSVAGLRFDTGWHGAGEGPRWSTKSRPAKGCVVRHPPGL